ncbi:hypothetical protein RM844_05640 [Streptomyces sp. DSM 44915]|uniref:Uncharacterized protein n=1 Tax=Streptomyces chisholmiae TaxID=3075540 RepID=A0ABU2JLB2_9ACTN|nr:hypothetical protein [Streptomyces sp. DSM 44915]MDT0265772.1 hypothetical protein [Streptomyces sp. DSM 44915]
MTGTALLGALRDQERALGQHLRTVADRHREEHEIHHVARDLAGWCRRHEAAIEAAADGALPAGPPPTGPGSGPEPGPRHPVLHGTPGRELLGQLRTLHLRAVALSVDWELLAQVAQARRRPELLALAGSCHPETLRQARWANAQLKVLSPQLLTD